MMIGVKVAQPMPLAGGVFLSHRSKSTMNELKCRVCLTHWLASIAKPHRYDLLIGGGQVLVQMYARRILSQPFIVHSTIAEEGVRQNRLMHHENGYSHDNQRQSTRRRWAQIRSTSYAKLRRSLQQFTLRMLSRKGENGEDTGAKMVIQAFTYPWWDRYLSQGQAVSVRPRKSPEASTKNHNSRGCSWLMHKASDWILVSCRTIHIRTKLRPLYCGQSDKFSSLFDILFQFSVEAEQSHRLPQCHEIRPSE